MPTMLSFQKINKNSDFFSPIKMSDGTFAGGFGRGHWGNGKFNIESVSAYINGVYTSTVFLKISGEMTINNGKIGEINAFIIGDKIILGHTENNNGQQTIIFGIVMENENNQFISRIFISSMHSPYMWCLLIPNK